MKTTFPPKFVIHWNTVQDRVLELASVSVQYDYIYA